MVIQKIELPFLGNNTSCSDCFITNCVAYLILLGNNTNVTGVLFRNVNDVMVGYALRGASTAQKFVDEIVSMPDGATKVYVTTLASAINTSSLKVGTTVYITQSELDKAYNAGKLHVKYKNSELIVQSPYGNSETLSVHFKNFGSNNLFDLSGINVNEGTSSIVSLLTPSTDFFTAYQINAVNNADGDGGRTDMNTGGNHAFHTNTGGKTAINENIGIYIDGLKHIEHEGYATFVSAIIVKLVQGNNTAKVDGRGRNIIRERNKVNFSFTYGKLTMDVSRTVEPFEDIVITRIFLDSLYISH